MSSVKLLVSTFTLGTLEESAKKLPEEAAEAFAEFILIEEAEQRDTTRLAYELADTIQAACNLAARYDIDLNAAMERCERRNRERGRYEMDGNRTSLDADGRRMDAGGDHDCCGRCHETATMTSTCDEDGVGHSTCGRCGRTVGRWYRFCPWCGARFEDAEVDDGMH